jgi:uncharacterized protein (TIGR00730 family)
MSTIRSVCVFCGASGTVAAGYHDLAADIGTRIAEAGLQLVYGGGNVGLMGTVANAALRAKGSVIGIIPEHLQALEVGHPDLEELVIVPDLMVRKKQMLERSDAFIILPGGFGTMDELFEVLTWKQLGQLPKPVIIVDLDGFFQPLLAMIDHTIEQHFARPSHRALFDVITEADELIAALIRPQGEIEHPRAKMNSATV